MKTVLSFLFIVGCVGIWYFIKKDPNKKFRNIAIGVTILSILLISLIPSSIPKKNEETSELKKDKKKKAVNVSLKLDASELEADKDGKVVIKGTATPGATVSIGMGIIGDSTKADKDGKFSLDYTLEGDSKTITINAILDVNKTSKKIAIKQNPQVLAEIKASKEKEQAEKEKEKATSDTTIMKNKIDKYEEVNKEIEKYLSVNKGWAMGTIDENANPIEGGTPNPEYANWLYVNSIKYDGSEIKMNVTADFQNLSISEKDSLASSAQGIVMSYNHSESTKRPFITVYNGDTIYGNSKALSTNKYIGK